MLNSRVDRSDLTSTQKTHLQREYDTLKELFDRVGLHTNTAKALIMDFQLCRKLGGHSVEAYSIRMTGEGKSFRNQLCQRVTYPDCDNKLGAGFLSANQQACG